MNTDELREKLAAIEHERWSEWQFSIHGLADADEHGNLVIPKALADRWSRQYHTTYADLSDAEKASDMEQVDRYWPLIEPYVVRTQDTDERLAAWLGPPGEDSPYDDI